MLPPQPDAIANGGADRLEVPPDALLERLQRRVAALERQLERRIAQVAGLQADLAEGQPQAAELELVRRKAAEYDALMATLTMRALRLPRSWYALARRRLLR